jgi:hypothetical protein
VLILEQMSAPTRTQAHELARLRAAASARRKGRNDDCHRIEQIANIDDSLRSMAGTDVGLSTLAVRAARLRRWAARGGGVLFPPTPEDIAVRAAAMQGRWRR